MTARAKASISSSEGEGFDPLFCVRPSVNRFVLRLLAPSNNECHSVGPARRERVKCTKGGREFTRIPDILVAGIFLL